MDDYTNGGLIKLMTVKIQKIMNSTEEDINPLDISFSNDKGFEPSTPSQTSPSPKHKLNGPNLFIRTPIQLFESQPPMSFYPQRNFTPPSRNIQVQISRFSTSQKENKKKEGSLIVTRRIIPSAELAFHEKRKKDYLNWQVVQTSHLRQISRLDSLLSRVEKNISLYSKLYPNKKRY